MVYVDKNDIERCKKIVKEEILKKNKELNGISLEEITIDIMNISYSKGGDYSEDIIRSFAMVYIDEFLWFQKEDN